jgi:hypothetical protein
MNPKQLKSPLRWYGGKARLAKYLLPLLPVHHRYVEVFGGGASMLLQKPPSALEVLNDPQTDLMDFWRVVKDPDLVTALVAKLQVTSILREEYEWCNRTYDYQASNGTFVTVLGLGQLISLCRRQMQLAAKPSEIFVNKESHDAVFTKSVAERPHDIIWAFNAHKAVKRAFQKYL